MKIARELTLKDEWKVGRIIARPYLGTKKKVNSKEQAIDMIMLLNHMEEQFLMN